ncbi:MAG: META domain-containing protein [Bacteroidales bacterium]|nr:META domain-containing protein [Bacteroidales bacterium]
MRQLFMVIGTIFLLSCSAQDRKADQQDMKQSVNDSWVAVVINGENLVTDTIVQALPQMVIHVDDMRYMGNDGCNNFTGGLIELDKLTIRFGVAAGTRMMCMDMKIPDLFNSILQEVMTWKIIENRLHLYDADGNELMQLKKTD